MKHAEDKWAISGVIKPNRDENGEWGRHMKNFIFCTVHLYS